MDHIIKSGLLRVDHEHQPENQGEADSTVQDDCDGSEAEDVVRPSQIDTFVQLSQGIVQALFGSPTPSEVDLSQGAVRRAFDISQDGLHYEPSAQDVMEDVTRLQRLSEDSGAESPDSDAPVASRLRPRRDFKCDVNFVGANENPSDDADFSSGVSYDGVLNNDEEDVVVRGVLDGEDDTISDANAVELDETFLASLDIGGQLSKSAKEKRTETLRAMRLTQPSSNFKFADE
ncbi:hypothetical protein PHMEG_00040149 [Phytophthora megakarya]|uniref:Uncharacterized protein n=1 Tax=Phytophthora megakarya TaxID=4795 RepID=A0A225UFF1_9STRA|nr:hypothetical protein PHMEG_00040149 [Phytophthora megakarya]